MDNASFIASSLGSMEAHGKEMVGGPGPFWCLMWQIGLNCHPFICLLVFTSTMLEWLVILREYGFLNYKFCLHFLVLSRALFFFAGWLVTTFICFCFLGWRVGACTIWLNTHMHTCSSCSVHMTFAGRNVCMCVCMCQLCYF